MPWTHIRDKRFAEIVRWSYLIIVVAASITLAVLFVENRQMVNRINEDRKIITYEVCLDQNSRHNQLDLFLRKQDYNKRNNPLLFEFVDLLAPKRNCEEYVKLRFGSGIKR